jgi:hypothetical protein
MADAAVNAVSATMIIQKTLMPVIAVAGTVSVPAPTPNGLALTSYVIS